MKLITKELQQRFKEIGDQSETRDPLFIAKFFDPCGSGTWYASEYDPEANVCYGYVTGLFEDEWGSFSIDELEELKLPFGLGIERDIAFKEIPSSHIIQKDRISELDKVKSKEDQDNEIER
ncbi:DUF2958 domain-containing protein [Psychroserpens sp. SPM9]|uniref:DUF2958 domain-containing protein n=1 Tax=Psychroserpens sp. SPM9 TaxID=2975598 RepID=UPI0021A8BA0D|nr:DUF2958 domain-containing protein [Psychroserpens sp. SPM9]MDG5490605.1 DUF2958 domain-containing protein [Psychroserpens sp. SPM9]